MLIESNAQDAIFVGIEIGGSKLQFVTGDGSGHILTRQRVTAAAQEGGEGIRRQIAEVLGDFLRDSAPVGIGVGFGGPVDWRTGTICCSHQVEGWSGFELGAWLSRQTGLPVQVENDSNLATLAEAWHGAGRGFNPCFYFNLGSGVGGGLVVDGRLYRGDRPGEAEFGHLRLDRQEATVESRCSGWAVDAKVRNLVAEEPRGLLARLVGGQQGGEARHLKTALEQGDASAAGIVRETAEDLGFALSHVVHLFHPQVVVMGGGLSLIGEPLRAAVATALRAHVMQAFQPGPEVRLAKLAEESVPVGALLLAGQATLGERRKTTEGSKTVASSGGTGPPSASFG
jgi:glucokinase